MLGESGINYVIGVFAFGDLPYARVAESMRLFASEAMPAVSLGQEVSRR
jgi:hypothetical protein